MVHVTNLTPGSDNPTLSFLQGLTEELETITSEHAREASAIHDLVCTHFGQFISCKNTIVDIRRYITRTLLACYSSS
jgi:hypothetical protein